MPRSKAATSPALEGVPPELNGAGASPQLEEPTAQVKAIVGGAVNVVDNAARQLDGFAPGWAYLLRQFVEVVDGVIRTAP